MVVNNRIWVGLTVILIVAIVLMGWFLGVSPRLGEVAANEVQRQGVVAQNDIYQAELDRLAAENEKLDDYEDELEELQRALPPKNDLSTFIGEVHQLELATGVSLTNFGAADAEPFEVNAGPEEAGVEVVEQTISPDEFVSVEVTLTVLGTQESVLDFVELLQVNERRFLVTSLSIITEDGGASYTGRIIGYVYVLVDPTRPSTDDEDEDEGTETPEPTASPSPSGSPDPSSSPSPSGSPTP